jgi:hypothetical protein
MVLPRGNTQGARCESNYLYRGISVGGGAIAKLTVEVLPPAHDAATDQGTRMSRIRSGGYCLDAGAEATNRNWHCTIGGLVVGLTAPKKAADPDAWPGRTAVASPAFGNSTHRGAGEAVVRRNGRAVRRYLIPGGRRNPRIATEAAIGGIQCPCRIDRPA